MYNELEYGQLIYVNFGEDISAATELTIILEPKVGTAIETTTGVSLGTANIDILSSTNIVVSDYTTFTVLE